MKRNYIIMLMSLLMLSIANVVKAEGIELSNAPKVWTVPAVFTADQEVTFYYDVTDVGFPAGVDLYLWAWQPTEPDAGHGGNSSDFAKLEYLGDNIYKITMTPTKYFNSPVSAFENSDWPGFWQRLKTKDGAYWSGVYQAPDSRSEWKAFADSGEPYQVFSGKKTKALTSKFTLNEPLTIVFNPNVMKVKGQTMTDFAANTPNFQSFNLHSGIDNFTYLQGVKVWIPKCMEKTAIQKLSNGFYSISMTSPFDYYSWNYADDGSKAVSTLQTDTDIENLEWLMVGIANNDWAGTSSNVVFKAGTAAPYPDPAFSFFPSKISTNDILTLTRQYNERTAGTLKYTISTASQTIQGTMEGTRDKRAATINLMSIPELNKATEIHIVISKEDGQQVVDTKIPLVVEDQN